MIYYFYIFSTILGGVFASKFMKFSDLSLKKDLCKMIIKIFECVTVEISSNG